MGKYSRHPIKNVRTKWVVKFGELGLETSCDIYTAKLPLKSLNLYFLTISGRVYSSDNLDFTTMCGYLAYYPYKPEDEEDHYKENYYHWAKGLIYNTQTTDLEIELIKLFMPNAKYVLDKLLNTGIKGNSDIYEALTMWQTHPEMEYLIANGFCKLGLDKRFWKLTDKRRNEIIQYCRQHKSEFNNPSLTNVRDVMNGIDLNLKSISQKYSLPYGVTQEYIDKYSKNYAVMCILRDYYRMARELNKDLKDKYWLMPKDIREAHDKVQKELENKNRERNNVELKKVAKKLQKYGFKWNGYTVFVPTDWIEIKRQAEELHQCLLTCNYDKKMMEGKCILVFIQKKGKPIATMEVIPTKRRGKQSGYIGQFYMDEHDRKNCLPTPMIRDLGQKWLYNYLAA